MRRGEVPGECDAAASVAIPGPSLKFPGANERGLQSGGCSASLWPSVRTSADPRRHSRVTVEPDSERLFVVDRELAEGTSAPAQSAKSSPSAPGRRQMPERPPVFSQSASSPIVMHRSTDLHMS